MYQVELSPSAVEDLKSLKRLAVRVKAVGWKEHNRLLIRGKEFDL